MICLVFTLANPLAVGFWGGLPNPYAAGDAYQAPAATAPPAKTHRAVIGQTP